MGSAGFDVTFPIVPLTGGERTIEDLAAPDARSIGYKLDVECLQAPYLEIEKRLPKAVPPSLRERVVVSRQLAVYGYFCYEFHAVSLFWSVSCIEMALKLKFGEAHPGPIRLQRVGKGTKETSEVPHAELEDRLRSKKWRIPTMEYFDYSLKALLTWVFREAFLPEDVGIPLQEIVKAYDWSVLLRSLRRKAQENSLPGPQSVSEQDHDRSNKLSDGELEHDQVKNSEVLIEGLPRFRNMMAHPQGFNLVTPPRSPLMAYELLIDMVSRLWPDAQREEVKMRPTVSETAQEWRGRIKLVEEWDERRFGPLVHRDNFDRFVVVERVSGWDQWQDCLKKYFQERAWVFRGHSSAAWRLAPSLERATLKTIRIPNHNGGIVTGPVRMMPGFAEERLLLEFQRRAHHYAANPPPENAVLDWLALMQHYGAPTRLLDWTRSPYVGLFFALEKSTPPCDCAVWTIDWDWLVDRAKEALGAHDVSFPRSPDMKAWHAYVNDVLLNINEAKVSVIAPADPLRMNDRVAAQQSLFLCNLSHVEEFDISLLRMVAFPTPPEKPVIRKIVIDTNWRSAFLRELQRMNINRASLFPGLEGFAQSLKLDLEVELDQRLGTLRQT